MTMNPNPPLTRLFGEDRKFQKEVRAYAEQKIRPRVREMDRNAAFEEGLIKELFSRGLMGIEIPREFGGSGGTFFQTLLCIEELARVDPAVAVCVDVQNTLIVTALKRWGTAEQKRQFLPRLASSTLGAYAMSERDSGSDAFSLSTRAEVKDDGFVLNGQKHWITNAAEAGLFLLFANAAPEKGAKGVTAFLIERESPGLSIGPRAEKLGIRASSTCEVALEDVFVPRQNLLGELEQGSRVGVETLNEGRLGIAAQMVGLAQGAFEAALAYAQTREQFGQPIARFQGVYFQIADMATQIEASRTLLYNGARLLEGDRVTPVERFRAAAMAKYFASVTAEDVASKAVEIFGGNGFSKDFPVEKFYRDAKVGKIYEGTTNMQLRTIATTLLGSLH